MGIAESHGVLSESKPVALAVFRMRSEMWPKFNQTSSNCYSLNAFIRVDVSYNDIDSRFRIGSINNADFAHSKNGQNVFKCIQIVNIILLLHMQQKAMLC